MAISSISNSGLHGLQKALANMRRNAQQIAETPTDNQRAGDLTRSLVELKQHAQQAKASVKAVNSADQLLGILLDEKA